MVRNVLSATKTGQAVLLLMLATSIPVLADTWLNPTRGFAWIDNPSSTGLLSNTSDTIARYSVSFANLNGDFTLRTVITNRHTLPDTPYPYTDAGGKRQKAHLPAWSLVLAGSDTLRLDVTSTTHGSDNFEIHSPHIQISNGNHTATSVNVPRNYNLSKSNLYILQRRGHRLSLHTGHTATDEVWSTSLNAADRFDCVSLLLQPGAEIDVAYLHIQGEDAPPRLPQSLTLAEIAGRIDRSGDPFAGYWAVTGRTLEENSLRCGGDYVCALIPEVPGRYVIYYLDGAAVNRDKWTPGMVKATLGVRLNPQYDVCWIDAEGRMLTDAVAIFDGYDTMTVHFPYYDNSQLTLQRLPSAPAIAVPDVSDP